MDGRHQHVIPEHSRHPQIKTLYLLGQSQLSGPREPDGVMIELSVSTPASVESSSTLAG